MKTIRKVIDKNSVVENGFSLSPRDYKKIYKLSFYDDEYSREEGLPENWFFDNLEQCEDFFNQFSKTSFLSAEIIEVLNQKEQVVYGEYWEEEGFVVEDFLNNKTYVNGEEQ